MSKKRISYGDRLLMGSIGNLEGLKRRLPTFDVYDKSKVQEAITAAGTLQAKLQSLLGSSSDEGPAQIKSALSAQSQARSAGQQQRQNLCGD